MYLKSFKRVFDFVLVFTVLIIISPLIIPIIIILSLTGEHFIFYGQKRIGYKNQNFKIWKFATMLKNSPNIGTKNLTLRNDPRVFPFGRFLRRTKLNELPQIFNILLGDMSFIGSRPLMRVDFEKYRDEVQAMIYRTPPGLTGIASVVFRDEERWISNAEGDKHEYYRLHITPYKGELELWYQKNISFYTDMMILFLTAWAIIFPESELVYKIFKDLPERPEELKKKNYELGITNYELREKETTALS
jgi:lipopolysaccharide/colanic/teichoic acid biosynthesis glycosyltransferase